jgi:hypothetical protein
METYLEDVKENPLQDSQGEESLGDGIGTFHDLNVQIASSQENGNEGDITRSDAAVSNSISDSITEAKNIISINPSPSVVESARGVSLSVIAAQVESPLNSSTSSPSMSLIDQPIISHAPKILSNKELLKMDPSDLARKLFDETLEGFSRAMVCPIIGRG